MVGRMSELRLACVVGRPFEGKVAPEKGVSSVGLGLKRWLGGEGGGNNFGYRMANLGLLNLAEAI